MSTVTVKATVARTAHGTQQTNTVRPVPAFVVKGKLFYKRKWDYNTSQDTKKFKEYLPGARIELHVQAKGEAKLWKCRDGALSEKGTFRFVDVPASTKLALKVFLEHKGGITFVKGNEDLVDRADFRLKAGEVVWRLVDLDAAKMTGAKTLVVDLGDVELLPTADADANIAALCDAYKTIWRGHSFIAEKTGHKLKSCPVNYPVRGISYHSAGQLYLLPDDLKDADVVLHEYGHYIGHEMLGGLTHPGYQYNDDFKNQHGPDTEEHYESAWNEGHATYLSSIINDDPIYRDGYDSNLTMDLAGDNITIGPHCEGSVQCALWDVTKVAGVAFKDGFWKAFCRTERKADTIFAFYENWKDAGCPDVAKLKASLRKFNLHVGYRYTRKLKCGDHALDTTKPDQGFKTVQELYQAYGRATGGTLAKYQEEFYNRNQYVGGGGFAEGAHARKSAFTIKKGVTYIVPERFEIS
jgi:hypothetical protein